MFKLDLTDTLNDKNIQALTKDTELQYDMTFISTKLDCLLKKLHFIVNQQGEKCMNIYSYYLYIDNLILIIIIGIVVSSWVGMLNIVRYHLKQYHIRSQTISGEIKISDRQLIVEAFNSDENRFMVKIK